MAGKKLVQAWGRAYLRGCLLTVGMLAWLAVVGGVGLAVLVRLDLPRSQASFFVPVVLIVWMATSMTAVLVWLFAAKHRRESRLDGVFANLVDRPAESAGPVARGWTGDWQGRRFRAWLSKGPGFDVYLDCSCRIRGAIGWAGRLQRTASKVFGIAPFHLDGALAGLVAHASDDRWMRSWLAEPGVEESLRELLTEDGHSLRSVVLQPGAVHLVTRHLPLADIDEEQLRRWLTALERLAGAVDRQPAPAEPLEAGRLEAMAHRDRGKMMRQARWIALGCSAAVVVGIVVTSLLIVAVVAR